MLSNFSPMKLKDVSPKHDNRKSPLKFEYVPSSIRNKESHISSSNKKESKFYQFSNKKSITLFRAQSIDFESEIERLSSTELENQSYQILRKPSQIRDKYDIHILLKQFKNLKFFKNVQSELGQHSIMDCLKNMQIEQFKQDQMVFQKGSFPGKLYVVLKGSVGVFIYYQHVMKDETTKQDIIINKNTEMNTLQMGDCFGEISLMKISHKQTATCICTKDCELLSLKKEYFDLVFQPDAKKKMMEKIKFFEDIPFLKELTPSELITLTYNLQEQQLYKGQCLYKEGSTPNYIYIIKSGEFIVEKSLVLDQQQQQQQQIQLQNELIQGDQKQKRKSLLQLKQFPIIKKQEITILSQGCIIGNDDINCLQRQNSVICHSVTAMVYVINKNQYLLSMRSPLNNPTGSQLLNNFENNRFKLHQQQIKTATQITNNNIHFLLNIPQPRSVGSTQNIKIMDCNQTLTNADIICQQQISLIRRRKLKTLPDNFHKRNQSLPVNEQKGSKKHNNCLFDISPNKKVKMGSSNLNLIDIMNYNENLLSDLDLEHWRESKLVLARMGEIHNPCHLSKNYSVYQGFNNNKEQKTVLIRNISKITNNNSKLDNTTSQILESKTQIQQQHQQQLNQQNIKNESIQNLLQLVKNRSENNQQQFKNINQTLKLNLLKQFLRKVDIQNNNNINKKNLLIKFKSSCKI